MSLSTIQLQDLTSSSKKNSSNTKLLTNKNFNSLNQEKKTKPLMFLSKSTLLNQSKKIHLPKSFMQTKNGISKQKQDKISILFLYFQM